MYKDFNCLREKERLMKIGDEVRYKGTSSDHSATITRVNRKASSSSSFSHIQSVEIMYKNGMKTTIFPSILEIINKETIEDESR